ncbi:30S ribosomal protein S9- chloroplastic [Striga hermonthica]|uniref:Small ribosomal subunit protein uS9c n=1 Tax=Striga hermonthica TaxID=68872 RepID=A0A9N7NJD2_STRHE|nr:30S ribosomal protein S9- chloroplastic [Striga hermonthica]
MGHTPYKGYLVNSFTLSAVLNYPQPSVSSDLTYPKASPMAMAATLSSLTSSFSSLSFSSRISPKPFQPLSFAPPKPLSLKSAAPKFPALIVASSAVEVDFSAAEVASSPAEVADPNVVEALDITKLVKSRLPGGFAAQTLIGTGRRKSAVARVVLTEGTGNVYINYREAKDYLQGNPEWLRYVKTPLEAFGYERSYDVFVKAHGGGLSGQAQAICLGVARALLRVSASHRPTLKEKGLLTRDSRVVERKKVGLKKARKRPQYSKR